MRADQDGPIKFVALWVLIASWSLMIAGITIGHTIVFDARVRGVEQVLRFFSVSTIRFDHTRSSIDSLNVSFPVWRNISLQNFTKDSFSADCVDEGSSATYRALASAAAYLAVTAVVVDFLIIFPFLLLYCALSSNYSFWRWITQAFTFLMAFLKLGAAIAALVVHYQGRCPGEWEGKLGAFPGSRILPGPFLFLIGALLQATIPFLIGGRFNIPYPASHRKSSIAVGVVLLLVTLGVAIAGAIAGNAQYSYTNPQGYSYDFTVRYFNVYPCKYFNPLWANETNRFQPDFTCAISSSINNVSRVARNTDSPVQPYRCYMMRELSRAGGSVSIVAIVGIGLSLTLMMCAFFHPRLSPYAHVMSGTCAAMLVFCAAVGFAVFGSRLCDHNTPSLSELQDAKLLPGPALNLVAAVLLLVKVIICVFVQPAFAVPSMPTLSVSKLLIILILGLTAVGLVIAGVAAGHTKLMLEQPYRSTSEVKFLPTAIEPCLTSFLPSCGFSERMLAITTGYYCAEFARASDVAAFAGIFGIVTLVLGLLLLATSLTGFAPLFLASAAFMSVSMIMVPMCAGVLFFLQHHTFCSQWGESLSSRTNAIALPGPQLVVAGWLWMWITVVACFKLPSTFPWATTSGGGNGKIVLFLLSFIVSAFLGISGTVVGHTMITQRFCTLSSVECEHGLGVVSSRTTMTSGRVTMCEGEKYNLCTSVPSMIPILAVIKPCAAYEHVTRAAHGAGVWASTVYFISIVICLISLWWPKLRPVPLFTGIGAAIGFLLAAALDFSARNWVECDGWNATIATSNVPSQVSNEPRAGPLLFLIAAIPPSIACIVHIVAPQNVLATVAQATMDTLHFAPTKVAGPRLIPSIWGLMSAVAIAICWAVAFEMGVLSRNLCCLPSSCYATARLAQLSPSLWRPLGVTDQGVCILSEAQTYMLGCDEDFDLHSAAVENCADGSRCRKKPELFNLVGALLGFSMFAVICRSALALALYRNRGRMSMSKCAVIFIVIATCVTAVISLGLGAGIYAQLHDGLHSTGGPVNVAYDPWSIRLTCFSASPGDVMRRAVHVLHTVTMQSWGENYAFVFVIQSVAAMVMGCIDLGFAVLFLVNALLM